MFGFLQRKRRDEVQRFLGRRFNRSFLPKMDDTRRRHSRGEFCEVVWVIPYDDARDEPLFDQTRVAVTRDLSPGGVSLLQTAPLNDVRIVLGMQGETGMHFLLCRVTHSTPLGYGFFQIGLYPGEFLHVDHAVVDDLRRRLKTTLQPARSEALCTA